MFAARYWLIRRKTSVVKGSTAAARGSTLSVFAVGAAALTDDAEGLGDALTLGWAVADFAGREVALGVLDAVAELLALGELLVLGELLELGELVTLAVLDGLTAAGLTDEEGCGVGAAAAGLTATNVPAEIQMAVAVRAAAMTPGSLRMCENLGAKSGQGPTDNGRQAPALMRRLHYPSSAIAGVRLMYKLMYKLMYSPMYKPSVDEVWRSHAVLVSVL